MTDIRVQTHRMELIAGNLDIVRAEKNDRSMFERLLNADVSDHWPPPLNDKKTQQYALTLFEKMRAAEGWLTWYFVLKDDMSNRRIAVGNGGFYGPPTEDGVVGIGYSVVPEYQRRGIATEAVNGLVTWAFGQPNVSSVVAETFPHLTSSIRVLEKNRFSPVGAGAEPGSVRYELPHAVFDDVWQRHSHL